MPGSPGSGGDQVGRVDCQELVCKGFMWVAPRGEPWAAVGRGDEGEVRCPQLSSGGS